LAPYPAYKTPNIRRLCVFRRPAQATRRRAIPEKRMLSAIGDDFRRKDKKGNAPYSSNTLTHRGR
ncbi:hypothetical protein, partial [Raoultella sp. YJ]|uniref:hypothetical protein n=1 Tax=Raoultella sp. YJ TaxID=1850565 RepID=UPI00197E95C9